MITVYKQKPKKDNGAEMAKILKHRDAIVKKVCYEVTQEEDGTEVKKRKTKLVNLTKMVNESKKTMKVETATQVISNYQNELLNKGVL